MAAVIRFLQAPTMAASESLCSGSSWSDLTGHWVAASILPHLPDRLPYRVTADGCYLFEPDRPMTRAEFVYGLARMKDLPERLQTSPFSDVAGHWSLGYVEAARTASPVQVLSADRFGPDQPLTRVEAIIFMACALGLSPAEARGGGRAPGEGRSESGLAAAAADPTVQGHWAQDWIEAAADRGLIRGDERAFARTTWSLAPRGRQSWSGDWALPDQALR